MPPTFVSDLFSDRSETVSDLFSARSETNGPPPKVIAKPAGDPEGASLWRSLRREGIVVRCVCATWVRVVGDSNILER